MPDAKVCTSGRTDLSSFLEGSELYAPEMLFPATDRSLKDPGKRKIFSTWRAVLGGAFSDCLLDPLFLLPDNRSKKDISLGRAEP